jgi:hypothetical protein
MTLHIFDDEDKLRRIIEALQEHSWYIEVAPREI